MPDLLERLKVALAERYEIERELGVGGSARVFLAQDLKRLRDAVLTGDIRRTIAICPGLREGSVRTGTHGLRSGTDKQGPRVVIAVGHRWGRGSLAEAARLWNSRRILVLTMASSIARWRLTGKSRPNSLKLLCETGKGSPFETPAEP